MRANSRLLEWIVGGLIAVILTSFPVWHTVRIVRTRHEIQLFSPVGWLNEQLTISGLLFVCAVVFGSTIYRHYHARSISLSNFLLVLLQSLACFVYFLRYFWISIAVYALLCLLYALVLLQTCVKAGYWSYLLCLSLSLAALFSMLGIFLLNLLGAGS
jgi:hypothetical protein